MQDRIWQNMADIKFKEIYTAKVARRAYHIGSIYSFFLSFASATSVAAWAVWSKFPVVWASIVAISQILHIAKPYILFIRNDREFIEMSLLYNSLYLSYEKLWFDYRKKNNEEEYIEKVFYTLRKKEHEINRRFKHIICPVLKGLMEKSDEETNHIFKTSFL